LTGPDVLSVAPGVVIAADELTWRFSASGGAGGQHVNTANTKAVVTFDARSSRSLDSAEWARSRILEALGPVITVTASDRRSQTRNRELALQRLTARLQAALQVRPERRPSRPTLASQRRRLEEKRRRGDVKRRRREGRDGGPVE
jgi:ribosome-associated protein